MRLVMKLHKQHARGDRQRGQAMIETIIAAALVLVPLFLAIPALAKYLDMRSHVIQSARYAAWERTVWFGGASAKSMGIGSLTNKWDANEKSDDAIRAEIGTRLLSKNNVAFSDNDKSLTSYDNGAQTLWVDRRGTSLLQDYGDISAKYNNSTAPGLINDLMTPVVDLTSVISSFTVDTNARYTANVGLAVKQVAFNENKSGLGQCSSCPVDFIATGNTSTFLESNVLVANGWNANGPGSLDDKKKFPRKITVFNQTRGLTPSTLLKPTSGVFADFLGVLNAISLVFFPEISTLDLGRVEVDKVPADRLK